jgi:hypothetical protein
MGFDWVPNTLSMLPSEGGTASDAGAEEGEATSICATRELCHASPLVWNLGCLCVWDGLVDPADAVVGTGPAASFPIPLSVLVPVVVSDIGLGGLGDCDRDCVWDATFGAAVRVAEGRPSV